MGNKMDWVHRRCDELLVALGSQAGQQGGTQFSAGNYGAQPII